MKKKYAKEEHERRFLCVLPSSLPATYRIIKDRYLHSTRLRVREVLTSDGSLLERKLTQKVREGSKIFITNTYLDSIEYQKLLALEGTRLRKRRYSIAQDDGNWAIDVFEDDLEGLVLAEIETEDGEELKDIDPPEFVIKEVTHDDFFSGGNLAQMNRIELDEKLAQQNGGHNSGSSAAFIVTP